MSTLIETEPWELKKKIPLNSHEVIKELPITEAQSSKKSRIRKRMRIFLEQGLCCETCGVVCNRLLVTKCDEKGTLHYGFYNIIMTRALTLGHVIPASAGGTTHRSNIRPLCHKCNQRESNGFDHIFADPKLFNKHCLGKLVRRTNFKNFRDGKWLAVVERIFYSDKHKGLCFGFVGGFSLPTQDIMFYR